MRKAIRCLTLALFVWTASAFAPSYISFVRTKSVALNMSTGEATKIEVVSQPDQNFLEKKGLEHAFSSNNTDCRKVFSWGTWGCGVSKFPWTYDQNESCYLLSGQVTVTPSDGSPPATFGKGDFVTFPAGMSCTWDVTEPVQKHFTFF